MVQATDWRSAFNSWPLAAATFLLAAAIFAIDRFTQLGIAVAVLYSVVILLTSRFLDWRGVLLTAVACAVLSVAGLLLSNGPNVAGVPILLLFLSLAAIAATTFLAIEDKLAAATLRERASLLDLTPDGIFVPDLNDIITYWNRGAEEAYGWTGSKVVGVASTHDLLHTVFPVPFEQVMEELLEKDRWEGELIHTRSDGTQMVVSSRWALQRDNRGRPQAILETNNDITAQRHATEALSESKEQWREVFEHNPVMYFMTDAGGTVLSVNSFGAGQLGYSAPELLGRSVLEVFREEDRDGVRRHLEACVTDPGQSRSWEARKVRKDGSMLWVRENAKAVRRPGNQLIMLVACEDITERRQNEDRLRRSEAYLSEAQRLSHVGSFGWQVPTGKIMWSEETFRIFGYEPADSPTLEMAIKRAHPEDRAGVEEVIDKARAEQLDFDHEYRLLMPDGSVKHVHLLVRFTNDSSGEVEGVGVVMDVTAAKEAESRIRQIIDAVPAFIWRAGPDGWPDYLNKRLLEYFGTTMEDVVPSGGLERLHPDDLELHRREWLSAVAEKRPYGGLLRVRRFDGEYRWLLERALPMLDASGNVLAWYGCYTDIHDRKLAEDALYKAQAELAHVSRLTTLGELSASIAHEVNQPLAAIVTNGEVSLRLLDREVPDLAEVRNSLTAMIGDGRRASEIIRRLRNLTIKTGTQKLELDLNDVVRDIVPLVREEVLGNRVSLRLELEPGLPRVLGDRVQLQQVIINLLVNACHAMASVNDRPRNLAIRTHGRPGEVLIVVRDSGVGIDPQNTRDLFEAFYTTKPNGMGMGLSICRSIVESHGGTIWASANDEPGATFQFTLPAVAEEAV